MAGNRSRAVRVVELDRVYASFRECAKDLDMNPSGISEFFKGKIKSHKGYTFELVTDFVEAKQKAEVVSDFSDEAKAKVQQKFARRWVRQKNGNMILA